MNVAASFVMLRAPSGKVLFLCRADTGEFAFPGGVIEPGETPTGAAIRECGEEIAYTPTGLRWLMRRVADGVDATTFVAECEREFVPTLNSEHTDFVWATPTEAENAA
jgi:8-oxo-dGTP pyrophosphatase MutT (NUDIX family)